MPRQNRYSSQNTSRKEGNYRYDAKPVYLQREGGNTYQNQKPSNNGMSNDYGRQPTSYGVDYSRNPRLYPRNDEFNRDMNSREQIRIDKPMIIILIISQCTTTIQE